MTTAIKIASALGEIKGHTSAIQVVPAADMDLTGYHHFADGSHRIAFPQPDGGTYGKIAVPDGDQVIVFDFEA